MPLRSEETAARRLRQVSHANYPLTIPRVSLDVRIDLLLLRPAFNNEGAEVKKACNILTHEHLNELLRTATTSFVLNFEGVNNEYIAIYES